ILALIPFRAPTLGDAVRFVAGFFSGGASRALPEKLPPFAGPQLLFPFAFVVIYHLLETSSFRRIRERFFAFPDAVRGIAYGLVLAFLLGFVPGSSGAFIYAQF